jgi:hypothetical protein
MLPLIKKRSHDLFVKLAFRSMIKVTTTNGNALSTFGLASTFPLARMVFDGFVFKPQGSSSADPISPEGNSLLTPRHEYDTPDIRDDLWVNHGIGTFTVKKTVAPVTPSLTFVVMLSVSDCHVHPPQSPMPIFVVLPCLTSFPQATFFWR